MGVGVKRWSEESTDSLIVSYSDNLDVQYLEKVSFTAGIGKLCLM